MIKQKGMREGREVEKERREGEGREAVGSPEAVGRESGEGKEEWVGERENVERESGEGRGRVVRENGEGMGV